MSRRVEVCDMQNAETTLAIIRDHWRAVCGESCKHGSGGGSWKRPERDLARSLPHRSARRCRRTKGTSLGARRYRDWACKRGFFLLLGLILGAFFSVPA